MFKETDDIIRLGKWAYFQIPGGNKYTNCLLLSIEQVTGKPYCELRPSMALIHGGIEALKDSLCPRKE